MDLISFLQFISDPKNTFTYTVIAIRAELPSALFFSFLLEYIRKNHAVTVLDLEQISLDNFKAQCAISFLGTSSTYWLKNLELLTASDQQAYLTSISEYAGPHKLYLASHLLPKIDSTQQKLLLDIPAYINQEEYQYFYQTHVPGVNSQLFIKKLFQKYSTISLDQAAKLIHYHILLGNKYDLFFSDWLDALIAPDTSLFTVSQLLFALDVTAFWNYWFTIKNQYSDEFWLVFWSEQIWQAWSFVCTAQSSTILEAKKVVSRLPFSFINKDWRKHSALSLAQAHHFITQLDYTNKNNTSTYGLELWLHKFFSNNFR